MKINKLSRSSFAGPYTCVGLLGLVALAMLCPISGKGDEAHAEEGIEAYAAAAGTVSLTMNAADAVDQSTNATLGTTAYRYNRFTVEAGTGIDKYQILVQAANGYSSNLVGASEGQTVNAVSGSKTGSTLSGEWGYSLAEGGVTTNSALAGLSYKALPASGSTTADYTTPSTVPASKDFTLAFAANIKDKPADHYQTNVLLSVAAGAGEVTGLGFAGIEYMQEMDQVTCYRAADGEKGRLEDIRDGKVYWVGKLKDNNCWMTQNLALDLDTTKPLTNTDSDISSSYTPTANTQQGTITKFPSSSDRTLSYNPGEYVYTTPTEQHSCGSSGITKLEGCPNWTLVTGLSKDTSGNEQAHYLAGNYYSYEVATAGYTDSSNSAPNSICPKGWQLPPSSGDKSYSALLTSYGTNSGLLYGTQDIRLAPLYFVYGGLVGSRTLYNAGSQGYYWSSTTLSADDAYALTFDTSVAPSYWNRYYGMSVRCVAR